MDKPLLKEGEIGYDIHDKEQKFPITIVSILEEIYDTDHGTYEFYELVPKIANS